MGADLDELSGHVDFRDSHSVDRGEHLWEVMRRRRGGDEVVRGEEVRGGGELVRWLGKVVRGEEEEGAGRGEQRRGESRGGSRTRRGEGRFTHVTDENFAALHRWVAREELLRSGEGN